MPISEKIIAKIKNSKNDSNFKELLLNILEEEDKGNHQYKKYYEKLVNEYLDSQNKEDANNDSN